MRQLTIRAPQGYGENIYRIAQDHAGVNLSWATAIADDQSVDRVEAYIENRRVENFLAELESIPDLHVTLHPRGVMPLQPPPSEAPQKLTDVTARSPLEIFLAGLQSVGSWKGFLAYSVVAGIVVWIGLYTNTNYLLVAAMLIAPFAGPAMNVAIASARGDKYLLLHGLLRYCSAIAVTIVTSFLLSLGWQQEIATDLMVSTSQISAVSVLLPLAAGAAGSLNLVQSERSSLVSGAAVGILIAASLAPPAGLVGMSAAIGRWAMMKSGFFLLVLQLVGINLSATIIFRTYGGLSARGARYDRGKRAVFWSSLVVTIGAIAILLFWQFGSSPNLQRSSKAQRATAEIHQIIDQNPNVSLVKADVEFTRANISDQNSLLCNLYVQRRPDVNQSDEAIRQQLSQTIQTELKAKGYDVTPLVTVTVFDAPLD